jgi:hypothetical protein
MCQCGGEISRHRVCTVRAVSLHSMQQLTLDLAYYYYFSRLFLPIIIIIKMFDFAYYYYIIELLLLLLYLGCAVSVIGLVAVDSACK